MVEREMVVLVVLDQVHLLLMLVVVMGELNLEEDKILLWHTQAVVEEEQDVDIQVPICKLEDMVQVVLFL